jgi:cytochrome c oxidase subunit 2
MSQNAIPKWLKRIALAGAMAFALLFTPLTALAQSPSPLRPGSGAAQDVASLFWIVTGVAAVVFVVVEALLIFAVVRYRRRFPDETPEQIEGNTRLEMIWTIIPAVILIVLFGLTLRVLRVENNAPADAYVVEVTGHQWFWEFNYPETEVTTNSRTDDLYIPADEPVVFEIRSNDVIHSFWVPELSGKIDAIPGHTNTLWFEAREGTYAGECAEFCGLEHYAMLFNVQVVPRDEFDSWMDNQIELAAQFHPIGTDMETPLPEGDPENGEALFTDLGCVSCHSLDGTQLVGPSMQNISERAGNRVDDMTADAYLRQSILDPCAHVVEGFTCVMPQNFGERLDAQGLADLIAFLEQE